jgi:voltage-dependent calcium channel
MLAAINTEAAAVEDLNDALRERRAQNADFIRDHPSYDKTFWLFSQKNVFRRACQHLVEPAGGERIFGVHHSRLAQPMFQLILLLTVISGIVIESIATPIYRRHYYQQHGLIRGSWFDIAEGSFAAILLLEFIIKIVADGFIFTPNAYVGSIWNCLDFIVLVGVIVNVTTGLIFIGGLSRLTRSLKALRVLRLITLIDKMRTTFKSLIILGALRIMDAAILAILYMIPYAVWGLTIFAGLMNSCNDSNATGEADCTNEYVNNLQGPNSFGFLTPRVWANPSPSTTFSFDTFRSSLLILFEIVSLEGWIDAMAVATSITGPGQQPQTNASQANALFFIIYNLLGGVVILTLFIRYIVGRCFTYYALLTCFTVSSLATSVREREQPS